MIRRCLNAIVLIAVMHVALVARAGSEGVRSAGLSSAPRSSGDFDAVNMFNGNLTVRVPLGGTYKTNGALSYSFKLHYNTNFWDYFDYTAANAGPDYYVHRINDLDTIFFTLDSPHYSNAGSEPIPEGNAGIGWLVGLGELLSGIKAEGHPGGAYRDETGAIHPFGPQLHSIDTPSFATTQVSYTHDGSFLRMRKLDDVTREIDFPDGTIKRFSCVSGAALCAKPDGVWLLDWIADPTGNVLLVKRTTATDSPAPTQPATGDWVWHFIEGVVADPLNPSRVSPYYQQGEAVTTARKHELWFERTSSTQSQNGFQTRLKKAVLAGPNGPSTYTMTYTPLDILRPPVYPYKGSGLRIPYGTGDRTKVSVLSEIVLPAGGGKWTFDYYPGGPEDGALYHCCFGEIKHNASRLGGQLKSAKTPTGGGYEYEYDTRGYAIWACGDRTNLRLVQTLSVKKRTQLPLPAEGEPAAWRYAGDAYTVKYDTGCEPWREFIGSSLDADGLLTLHYFDLGHGSATYGAHIAPDLHDDAPAGARRFLSTALYDAAPSIKDFRDDLRKAVGALFSDRYHLLGASPTTATLLRRTFAAYELSDTECRLDDSAHICEQANLRRASEHTRFYDDAQTGAFVETKRVDYDGLGHYRGSIERSNFASLNRPGEPEERRLSYIRYNDGVSYGGGSVAPAGMPASTDRWLLNLFAHTSRWEAGKIAHVKYRHDTRHGFLTGMRTMKNDTFAWVNQAEKDVVASKDDADFVRTYSYASTSAGQMVITENSYGGFANTVDTDWPDSGDVPEYVIVSTTKNGSRESSEYRACDGTAVQTYSATIDARSGLPLSESGSDGAVTAYQYDDLGRVTQITPPGYQRADTEEREERLKLTYANPNRVTVFHLKPDDTEDPDAPKIVVDLDTFGRVATESVHTPAGVAKQDYKYTADELIQSESAVYSGEPKAKTWFEYDVLNRITLKRLPDNEDFTKTTRVEFDHDGARHMKIKTDGAARIDGGNGYYNLDLSYDGAGRTTQANDGLSNVFYRYTPGGLLREVKTIDTITTAEQVRTLDYDGRGVLTAEQHPELDGRKITYGNIDSRGNALWTEYVKSGSSDSTHRLAYDLDRAERLRKVYQVAGTTSYTYKLLKEFEYNYTCASGCMGAERHQLRYATRFNHISDPTEISQPLVIRVVQEYRYDAATGRLRSVATSNDATDDPNDPSPVTGTAYALGLSGTVSYKYNRLGLVKEVAYPTFDSVSRTVTHNYTRGMLSSVGQSAVAGSLATLTYFGTGALQRVDYASGISDELSYDPANRVQSIIWRYKTGDGALVSTTLGPLSYDGVGNVSKIGTADHFWYDAASRLKKAETGSRTQEFTYDGFSNLKKIVTSGDTSRTTNLNVDAATNRLPASEGYVYNARGDMEAARDLRASSGTIRFAFDASGQMSSMEAPDFGRLYVYSADDERVGTIDYRGPYGWRERWSFRDGNRVIRDVERTCATCAWKWTRDYVYRGDTLAVTFSPGPSGQIRRDVHVDHLGSTRMLTNRDGRKTDGDRRYLSFGEPVTKTATPERLAFTGHERDFGDDARWEADFDFMHARYYSPALGRFLSLDPVRGSVESPQSWNLYAYVRNNPMTLADPLGLQANQPEAPEAEPVCDDQGECSITVTAADPAKQANYGLNIDADSRFYRRDPIVQAGAYAGDFLINYAEAVWTWTLGFTDGFSIGIGYATQEIGSKVSDSYARKVDQVHRGAAYFSGLATGGVLWEVLSASAIPAGGGAPGTPKPPAPRPGPPVDPFPNRYPPEGGFW